ncbi:DUF4785 domain-containing protein [Shewanella woodyi]|uniref:DUF4785 domain-containing protein n=1 Tax=Shewanella woodyi TaxID=60961 RepID=UPI003749B46A
MKKLTHLATSLAMASLLVACQDDAQTEEPQAAIAKQQTKSFTLAAPQTGDFSSTEINEPTLPPINSSPEAVSFVTKVPSDFTLTPPVRARSVQSDEYWTKVTGDELNRGVKLAISQAASVIRISPRGDTSSGTLTHSKAIEPETIQLLKEGVNENQSRSYIKSLADSQALATAGLTDDSSALILSSDATAGQYRLKVSEKLEPNASYIVNVKEKHSPYKLKLTSKDGLSSTQTSMPFQLELSNNQTQLKPKASLKHANGHYQALEVEQVNGQWSAKLPELDAMPVSNSGLSEIQLEVQTDIAGKQVIRTVKKAFKQFVPSAKIQPEVSTSWEQGIPSSLTLSLEMKKAGRFSVAGFLTGVDTQGNDKPILRTESADWLTLDSTKLTLKLDTQLIAQSGLKPPYKLQGLTLKDQGQMARLSYQAHGVTLN